MKLPINHIYFQWLKNHKKQIEYRDAHITFIDEDTKEKLRINIIECFMTKKERLPRKIHHLFEDDKIIAFVLDND